MRATYTTIGRPYVSVYNLPARLCTLQLRATTSQKLPSGSWRRNPNLSLAHRTT